MNPFQRFQKTYLKKDYLFEGIFFLLVSLFGIHMVFLPSLAASEIIRAEDISDKKTLDLMIASMQNETRSFGLLPRSVAHSRHVSAMDRL